MEQNDVAKLLVALGALQGQMTMLQSSVEKIQKQNVRFETGFQSFETRLHMYEKGVYDERKDRLEWIKSEFSHVNMRLSTYTTKVDELGVDLKDGLEAIGQQIDAIMSVYDRDDIERVALSAQVERHDKWIKKAAPKIQIKYNEAS